jgi:ABC-type transport system substrate-binding protein
MLFRKPGAIMVAFLAISLVLHACGPPTTVPLPTWPEDEPGSLRCECGYHVVIGQVAETISLNPILARDPDGFWLSHLLFDSLVQLDPETGTPLPHLARSWDISEDDTTYTFHLVDRDVRWSDG